MPDALLREAVRLHQAGRFAEAEAGYRQVLAARPQDPDALHYLGLLAYQARAYDHAARLIGAAVALRPDVAAAHSNLGNALAALGRFADAEAALRRAVELDSAFADAWFNLGNVLREQQRLDEADAAYRRVIALRPNHAGAFNNLANLLLLRGRREQAAEAFDQLGDVLQDVGRIDDAASAYRQAKAANGSVAYDVKLAFLAPVIPMSVAEIERTRERLDAGLTELGARGIALDDPLRAATSAIFYTGYHGRNDRELRRRFADFYLGACPELGWRAPHCAHYAGPDERIRIGFVSRFFHPEHPMSKLYGGIAEQLDRRRFDISLFRFDSAEHGPSFGAERVTVLATELRAARVAVAAAKLDVLFYTDIGMEPTTYFLAFARLAPVQCVTFGHPITSGIANVDYFLSAHELDLPEAQDHYTETLIRLAAVPTYFRQPPAPKERPTRAELNLPADATLYFCAQNLIKYHPDFDAVLAEILRTDRKGLLALTGSAKAPPLQELLLERFRRTMPDVASRVTFTPFLKLDAMLGFLGSVDAVLDTPVFGGGTTSLEMFAVDAPVVTWPGPFARSRITHALYRQMGVDGLSAASASEYVAIALRLAHDVRWRQSLQAQLRARKHVLYENGALVRELERFFGAAVAAAREGDKVRDWAG